MEEKNRCMRGWCLSRRQASFQDARNKASAQSVNETTARISCLALLHYKYFNETLLFFTSSFSSFSSHPHHTPSPPPFLHKQHTPSHIMLDDGIKTNLEWTSALDIDYQPTNTRKTSIICTIGTVSSPFLLIYHSHLFLYRSHVHSYHNNANPRF